MKNKVEMFPVEGVHHLTAHAINAMHIDVGNVQSLYTLLEERHHVIITLADTMLLGKEASAVASLKRMEVHRNLEDV